MAIIRDTRHPLVDVGAATIAAFSHKERPEDVTEDDLGVVVKFIERYYNVNPMKSFLFVFFQNSGFINPNMGQDKRRKYIDQVLSGYRETSSKLDQPCVFCGRVGGMIAFREQVPLLGAVDVFNFYPEGRAGLVVCGACMLCVQAFPLGAINCNGRALIVHSDWPEMTRLFAARFLERNQRTLLDTSVSLDKMPKLNFVKTTLMESFLEIEEERGKAAEDDERPCSITAYHLTNYGTKADIDIYYLPIDVVSFIRVVNRPRYKEGWTRIVGQAWEQPKLKKGEDEESVQRRNFLYEDLFSLPQGARRFLRTYLLRRPLRSISGRAGGTDPRGNYNLGRDAELVSWDLTVLFLSEVMNMEKERIEAIRELGDRLADYTARDQRILGRIHSARKYGVLRELLLRADLELAKTQESPLLSFDGFLIAFDEAGEMAHGDWSLARDLVLIRMIEQLHKKNAITPEVLKEVREEDTSDEEDNRQLQ